jgi:putative MATE family efflux protein
MTSGPIWKNLLAFAFPLMIGNLFQQLYNTVDAVVVGNFVGKEALAAVGTSDSLINTIIGFFAGMSTGAGVVISQYYGAQDEKRVSDAVHTTIAFTLILCAAATVVALALVPTLLRFMGVPSDVMPQSRTYLRIYFMGVTGLMLYNMGSGILRAVGDSIRPLYFLIFSALMNVALDLLFVVALGWGVAGVAWATILTQGMSAALVLATLIREKGMFRLVPRRIRIHRFMLGRIVQIGLPSAVQMAVTSFSNIFVQSYINAFGSAAMAGWSSYAKIDKVLILPIQSVSLASTTFTGQNLGADDLVRVRKGPKVGVGICFVVAALIAAPTIVFADRLVGLFSSDAQVVAMGTFFVRLALPFYFALCVNQVYMGFLRGIGNTRAPMVFMMFCFIVARQAYLFVVSRVTTDITWTALGYPFGWILCTLCILVYIRTVDLKKYRLRR